jgi:transmembrane sensor
MTPLGPHDHARDPRAGTDDDAQLPALGWLRRAGAQDELLREVERHVSRRRKRRWLGAVAATALLVAGSLAWRTLGVRPWEPVARAPTATLLRPERQRLPDGSVVDLRDGAAMTVDFDGPLRRVVLRGGEAYFAVAGNPLRPFVVEAGGVSVRAVGTAFSVHHDRRQTEVVVTEGQVAVASSSAATSGLVSPPAPALVSAGHRCVIPLAAAPDIRPVSPAELHSRLGWRIPQLEFTHTPLAEVVALMNAHHPRGVRFVLGDPDLGQVSLSGFLRSDNDEGLANLLETQFAVRTERVDNTITLRARR